MFFGRRTQVEQAAQTKPAEFFVVSASGSHLKLDFLTERADGSFSAVRVLLTREFAEKTRGVIESTIHKYEAARGHIRVAREQPPASPRLSSLEERAANQLKVSFSEDALFFDFALILNTTESSSQFDRLLIVSAIGLAPPLLAAITASLKS